MSLDQDKRALRAKVNAAVGALGEDMRKDMDQAVVDGIFDLLGRFFHLGNTVLAYVPLKDEVDITPILLECLELDCGLALPRIAESGLLVMHRVRDVEKDLVQSGLGVWEPRPDCPPVPYQRIDLSLIPGRAFDASGRRLGRGTGHYDRALAALGGLSIGIAYDCQLAELVPTGEGDQPVDVVLTPTRVIEAKPMREGGS